MVCIRKVHCFQCNEKEPKLRYYIFEITYILGVTKRSVYRLLKKIGLRLTGSIRNRRLMLADLIGIVSTGTFKRYMRRLNISGQNKIQPVKTVEYENIPKSLLHLQLKTPKEFINSKVLKIDEENIQSAIACGLLPVVNVGGEIFVHPELLKNGGL